MPAEVIDDLSDPRLEPYRDLRHTNETRDRRWIIAEGRLCVKRLLESEFTVDSVVISHRRLASIEHQLDDDVKFYVVEDAKLQLLLGFHLHSGMIACGTRPADLQRSPQVPLGRRSQLFVACPHTVLPDNLGSIIRTSAALGADGVLVGHQSIDPFLRRVVRISMGAAFQIPIYLPGDLQFELNRLQDQWGFRIVASTLDGQDQRLSDYRPWPRSVVLFGNEGDGLGPAWLDRSDDKVTIPMHRPVDSLNVASAAAIVLYHFAVTPKIDTSGR